MRVLNFMRRAMTGVAFGCGGIAFPDFLPMDAAGVFSGYLLVAAGTRRLGDAGRVGVLFMLYVAGRATD